MARLKYNDSLSERGKILVVFVIEVQTAKFVGRAFPDPYRSVVSFQNVLDYVIVLGTYKFSQMK